MGIGLRKWRREWEWKEGKTSIVVNPMESREEKIVAAATQMPFENREKTGKK